MWAGKQASSPTTRIGTAVFRRVRPEGLNCRGILANATRFRVHPHHGDIGITALSRSDVRLLAIAAAESGFTHENVFRGSGLLIHGLRDAHFVDSGPSFLPAVPRPRRCSLFIFNKTLMPQYITQHASSRSYASRSVHCSRFMRSLEPRWFYAHALPVLLSAQWKRACYSSRDRSGVARGYRRVGRNGFVQKLAVLC